MPTNTRDLRKVLTAKHENKWVALSLNRKKVVAFSDSLAALRKKIGDKEVVYMKVPESGVSYAF